MGAHGDLPPAGPAEDAPSDFVRLAGAETLSAARIAEDLRRRAAGDPAPGDARPYVVLNMASTLDGRVTIGGRSGAIGGPADGELFRELRGVADAVMAGAGTVRAERYGPIVRDPARRRLRRDRGLAEQPLACVVSGRLALEGDIPLLADGGSRVVIVTSSQASLPPTGAHLQYIRAEQHGRLDLTAAMRQLRERFAVGLLLCEGGPSLNRGLLSAGLVDELFLTLSPKLAAGEAASGGATPGILAGAQLDPVLGVELRLALASDSYLFLHYGVRASAAERVSRETMPSSSLAS